jgi:hypothetical protein
MNDHLWKVAAWVAGPCAVASLVFGWWRFGLESDERGLVKKTKALVLCAWILLPPIWFCYEFWRRDKPIPDFDYFKHAQDLASKIWLALVSVLLILYFRKDLGK